MCTIPIFKNPKVFMIPIKDEKKEEDGWIQQAWFPWQVCTNCLAGRAKGRCSLYVHAIQVPKPFMVEARRPGEKTDNDAAYGWFTNDWRDAFLRKDLGYYKLWICRDGTENYLVSVIDALFPCCEDYTNSNIRLMCRMGGGYVDGAGGAGLVDFSIADSL